MESGRGGNVQGITIANLTIRDLDYHPIIFNGGTQIPRVYNVHLINAGQQFIKAIQTHAASASTTARPRNNTELNQ